VPVAVGFGISTPQQFAAVGDYADAGVVGSAIVHTIERNPGQEAAAVREFVAGLVKRGVGRARTSATRA
jgi:tryptophan synthase alpha chain